MFSIIRTVFGFLFLLCSIIAIKKSKTIRKRILYFTFIGLSVILVVTLAFLPIENFFITFDSPEAAYAYSHLGNSDIELILEGDNCDLIVDCKDDTDTYWMVPKTEDGWKVGIGTDMRTIVQKLSDGISLDVYQYKNTNDYFITILNTDGVESTILDVYNTQFYSLESYNDYLKKTFVTYYAHITDFGPQYSVFVNDSTITFGDRGTVVS